MAAATTTFPAFGVPVRFQRAELAGKADVSDRASALLSAAHGPEDFLAELHASGNHRDLIAALAFMLPKRQAVWWACLGARLGRPAKGSPHFAALTAAENWVQSQNEDAREAAGAVAEALDFEGPAAWAALGAYWSGGSIGPRDGAPVAPAPHLTGTAVRGALLLSVAEGLADWTEIVDIGLDILAGKSGREAFDAAFAATRADA